MKPLIKIGCKLLLIIILIGCNKYTPKKENIGYFEDLEVLKEPVEFAKQLSLPQNTWKGSISKNGSKFYFFRNVTKNKEDYRIYESEFKNGIWIEPKEIEFSNDNSDLYPVINNNGKSILFVSYRRLSNDTVTKANANFWKSEYKENKWSKPVFLDDVSIIKNYDSQPTMTSDGDIYYTSSTTARENWEIITLFSRKVQNGYASPERFDPVNQWRKELSEFNVYEICMSPSKDYLIVNMSKKGGKADLYISKKEDEKWSEPRLLGNKINTAETENFPYITSDGKYLFFTREFSKFYHISTSEILNSNDEN